MYGESLSKELSKIDRRLIPFPYLNCFEKPRKRNELSESGAKSMKAIEWVERKPWKNMSQRLTPFIQNSRGTVHARESSMLPISNITKESYEYSQAHGAFPSYYPSLTRSCFSTIMHQTAVRVNFTRAAWTFQTSPVIISSTTYTCATP